MGRYKRGRKSEKRGVPWENLPHGRLGLEIVQTVAYRVPHETHHEMRLRELAQKLPEFCDGDHSEYARLISAEINRELRICRDVYRKFLATLNNKSRTAKWSVALDFAVAPRASLLLRREICAYLRLSRIDPLIVETFLADRPGLMIPLDNSEVRTPHTDRSLEEVVALCVPLEGFQNLKRRFKRESFAVGGPFALCYVLRRAMSYGITVGNISPIYKANEIWISQAGIMWDNTLREIVAQQLQIDLEERSDAMVAVESLAPFDRIAGPLYAEASERYTTIPDDVWERIGTKIDLAGISLETTLEPEGKRILRDLARQGIFIKTWREALVCDRDFGVLESKVIVEGIVRYRGLLNRHAKRIVYRARDKYQKVLKHIYEERSALLSGNC